MDKEKMEHQQVKDEQKSPSLRSMSSPSIAGCNATNTSIQGPPHELQETEFNGRTVSEMDSSVDQLIDDMGFGPSQILCAIAVCLFQITSAFHNVNTVFVNRHNITSCYSVFHENLSKEEKSNFQYELNSSNVTKYEAGCESSSPYIASFSDESTFYNEFHLIGNTAWISSLYDSIFILGIILGNIVSGLSDFIGRLTLLRWGLIGYLIGTLLVSLSPNIYVILISRFVIGFTHEFYKTPALTLLMEITPVKQRSILGIMVIGVPYPLAGGLFSGLAYLIRPWRLFHLISSIPVIFLAICIIFVTKSPRWLITQNRLKEAADVIEKITKQNKGKVPSRDRLMSILNTVVENSKKTENSTETRSICQQATEVIKLLFVSPVMRRITLITSVIYIAFGLIYFGITLNANNFTSNIYIFIALIHLGELFPFAFISLLINRFGNVLTTSILIILTGLCLLGAIILPDIWWIKWPLEIVASVACACFGTVTMVMFNELFPTIVRSIGSGFCSLSRNIGTLLAVYFFKIVVHQVWWLPRSVCVVVCIISIVLLQLLPETNGQPLCETVEEVEKRAANTRLKSLSENST